MFRKAARSTEPTTKVSIRETAPCQKSLHLHVGLDTIALVRAAVLAEFQREATLPGFRKGKAPIELVERQYAKPIQDEVLHRVSQQAVEQAAKDHALKPVGPVEITKADFDESQGLTLEATVEVEPSFKLAGYKGIPLTQGSVEINSQDLDQALAQMQESMAQLVPSGEGQPKERHVPPLDDELAKDLGFESLAKLKQHVEAKLREQKRTAQSQAMEALLCEELLKRHAFEVPPRLVGRQIERLTRDFRARLLLSGLSEEQVAEKATSFTEELRQAGERHVKLAFILDRIAQAESVTVTQDELVGRLWQLAKRWKKDPAEVRKLLDAEGLWPSVISAIRQGKTMHVLLSAAAIENGTTQEGSHGQ